ncbi:uncharacterized protein LOC125946719 [Dermacentor silvarum]|uniref:uncharacterized protein LOC125946719 n=1 Tax=Dermacentor silvarum TaxID=543639 RepID=UPI002100F60D|nr:uncharacterized protein LOC125946719 [Dermacentor silvarum]
MEGSNGENFDVSAHPGGGWRSDDSGNGGDAVFSFGPPWLAAPSYAWRPPFRARRRGCSVRPGFAAGRRPPLLPTPPVRPTFSCNGPRWQSSPRYFSTCFGGRRFSSQSHHAQERRTDESDNGANYDSELFPHAPHGHSEAFREHRRRPRRSRSHSSEVTSRPRYGGERPFDHNASGVSEDDQELRYEQPHQRKRSSSPATESRYSTSVFRRQSPTVGRSFDGEAKQLHDHHLPGCDANRDADSTDKRRRTGCAEESSRKERSRMSTSVPPQMKRSETSTVIDSAKKMRAGGVVQPSSNGKRCQSTVGNATQRPKPALASAVLISAEMAKYRIPKLKAKERRSSDCEIRSGADIPSVQQPCSSGVAENLRITRHTSDPETEAADSSPQLSTSARVQVDAKNSRSSDRNTNLEPACLAGENRVQRSSHEARVPSLAIADSANPSQAVGKDSQCEVASVTECRQLDEAAPLSLELLSLEECPVTSEHCLCPGATAFEKVGAEDAFGVASERAKRFGISAYDPDASVKGLHFVRDSKSNKESQRSCTSIATELALCLPSAESEKEGTLSEELEQPLVGCCDSQINSDATEVYECDPPSCCSEGEREIDDVAGRSGPERAQRRASNGVTEVSEDSTSFEENSGENEPGEVEATATLRESPVHCTDSIKDTRQTGIPDASTPSTTGVIAATTSYEPNSDRSVSRSVPAFPRNSDRRALELSRPLRESVKSGASSTNFGLSGSPGTTRAPVNMCVRPAGDGVFVVFAAENSPSPSEGHCAVGTLGTPPIRIPMYEMRAPSPATGTRRFPVVDGPDGRRGALFELDTVLSLYVLNLIEDHATKQRVLQLYCEGRHSDAMEAYGAEIRALARAAVERPHVAWDGLIGVLRRLTKIEWTFPEPGCAGARIQELCDLEAHYKL